MKSPLATVLKLAVSAVVSALLVVLLLRLTRGADGPSLGQALRATAWTALAGYVALSLVGAGLRAVRYRLLLAAGADTPPPSTGRIALVAIVRNMVVDMLPARLGELSYIAMLNRGYRVSGERCVSSLSVSFVFDLVALVILILALAILQGLRISWDGPLFILLPSLGIPVAVVTLMLFRGLEPCMRLLRVVLGGWARRRAVERVLGFLDRVVAAIRAAAVGGVLARVLLLSLGVRLLKYGGLFLLFRGVTIVTFPKLAEATFLQVMLALIGGEAGASLALPTLMGFGTYEAGSLFALSWFGFPASAAAVAMLALHIWSQCVDYVLGGIAFIAFLFTTSGAGARRWPVWRGSRRRLSLAAGAVVVTGLIVVAAGAVAWRAHQARKRGATEAPPAGVALPEEGGAGVGTSLAELGEHGFVVWSSNRAGNHDIYRMSLADGTIAPITRHPHVETYPRISPDGRRVVFCRGQAPWVSQRNPLPWDVIVVDLESGEERLAAHDGNTPSWSADGQTVYFQRAGDTVVALTLDGGAERVVFDAAALGLPAGTQLQTPSLAGAVTHERLAVTLRGRRRGTAIIDPAGDLRDVAGGCQLTWGPGGAFLYYVDHGGRMENQVYRVDARDLSRAPWLDLPGEYSHEYFPRVSPDGRLLVLGACAEGHEHDTADYEIFLWEIGAPAEAAKRLTYHTGNDCWPDIWTPRGD